jgi:hypothetical protein
MVKLSLCHEDVWGSGGIAPTFLTSALHGDEWSVSRPCLFTLGETAPDTHWIGGWVNPRVGLDDVEKKESCTAGNRTRAVQPVTHRYTN